MSKGLSEFKVVPSIPILAVSADGMVVHHPTGRTVTKHINDEDQEYVIFYTYDPLTKKNETNLVYVTNLIEEAYGVKTEKEFKKVPSQEFVSVSRDGHVINNVTRFDIPVYEDENDGPFIKIVNGFVPFKNRGNLERLFVKDLIEEAFRAEDQEPKIEPDTKSKMIRINNVPMTREALLQIKRARGRHYPGPLRDQTIWDLIDYLIKEVGE